MNQSISTGENLGKTENTTQQTALINPKLLFRIDSSEENQSKILIIYSGKTEILKHTLFKSEGDCSAINIELGAYHSNGDELVLYSYWAAADRQNIALFPFGFRKQTYQLDKTGNLIETDSKVFVEDNIEKKSGKEAFYPDNDKWNHRGIEFLYRKPNNNFQQKALSDYTRSIEQKYLATFVLGKEKELLENEVRSKLRKEIDLNTKDWDQKEIYGSTKK